jgi:hypothetical protein
MGVEQTFDKLAELEVLEEIARAKLIEEPHGVPPKEKLAALKKKVIEQVSGLTRRLKTED